ncbi:hypothetical protein [Novosphingobium resinovorum]|uniref:hypothetical protein n=1 Tax=Novosphingobium resinovorum TaxID=158500 RepID=UPI0012EA69CC|nr:hypothetical protein [Novosphingobium resinovorum]
MTDSAPDQLAALRENLVGCADKYLNGDLPAQRLAVANALVNVAQYLEAHDFPPDALLPILRPAVALVARENNALDQMFVQRSRNGRPGNTNEEFLRFGILAGFANAWLQMHKDDGRTQSVKLTAAARKMSGGWFGQVSRAKLETAREIVSREPKDHLAVETARWFDSFFNHALAVLGPNQAFPLMVRHFSDHPAGRVMDILKTPPVSPTGEG